MIAAGQYEFLAQDRVVFGKPANDAVCDEADRIGASRIFIVASRTLSRRTHVVSSMRECLGGGFVGLFDECIEHVPRTSALALATRLRESKPDMIVTIGGGTPIDTVKVALICFAEDITNEEALGEYRIKVEPNRSASVKPVNMPSVRQIVVPTTLSGAEFSDLSGAVDSSGTRKDVYSARGVGARVVILDPEVTLHTPDALWLSTGIRAIDHAVETVCSRSPQPFTDATCLHGLTLLARSLRKVKVDRGDLDARLESQFGVWLATTGLGRIPWGASHGIGHQLSAVAHVPHGQCSCAMLPSVLRYNAQVNRPQQERVALAMGYSGSAADAVSDLIRDIGMPGSLRNVGVERRHFDAIIDGALTNVFVNQNPRPIRNRIDVAEILELAW